MYSFIFARQAEITINATTVNARTGFCRIYTHYRHCKNNMSNIRIIRVRAARTTRCVDPAFKSSMACAFAQHQLLRKYIKVTVYYILFK